MNRQYPDQPGERFNPPGGRPFGTAADGMGPPGRDVKNGRSQFSSNLVHVGNHQSETLTGRKRRCQRTTLKRTMNGTSRTTFCLQFDYARRRTPDIALVLGAPKVSQFSHGRSWSDWIDGDDFACAIGDMGSSLITIHGGQHGGGSVGGPFHGVPGAKWGDRDSEVAWDVRPGATGVWQFISKKTSLGLG